jgi:peptide/nickel transport system substrate-binding protein
MRNNKRQLLTVFLVLTLVVPLAAACGPTPEPQVVKETVVVTEKETVVVTEKEEVEVVVTATALPAPAISEEPVRFLMAENFWADWEPYNYSAQSQRRVTRQIFDHLVEANSDNLEELSPGLATSWEIVDDTTWEFELREGVKFHNGQSFTAKDVKASIELATGATGVQNQQSARWPPVTVEIVDDYTVRLKTEEPFGPLLLGLPDVEIHSAEDLEAGDEDQLRHRPNGTGPFRLVKDEPTRKEMEAFPDYWGGEASIKNLVWEFVQDPQVRLSALLAGQAHAIDRVPPEQLGVIAGSPDFSLTSVPGMEMVVLWFQWNPDAPWTNPDFRKAIAWSVDRETLARALVQGNSAVAKSYLPDAAKFFEVQEPAYTFDLDKAKEYLEKAGMPDGGPEFELWVADGFQPRAKEVGEAMVSSMQQVGLKPKLVVTDLAGLINAIGLGAEGAFRMIHISWSGNGDPDRHLRFLFFDGGVLWTKDEKVNELLDAGSTAVRDEDRARVYGELQTYLWEAVPNLQLYNSDFTVAYTDRLEGLRVLPNFATDFYPARLTE